MRHIQLLASAARTAAINSANQTIEPQAMIVFVDVTADPATADVTPNIQIRDEESGKWITVWTATAALSAVGHVAYLFGHGTLEDVAGYTEEVSTRFSAPWRFRMTVADTDSMTYSVGVAVVF